MKAIILAAGMGTRLGELTKEKPKAMLIVSGKTLLERNIERLRKNGVRDISVVAGYMGKKIHEKGVKKYVNAEFADTNMVYSLFCAEKEFDDNLIVVYGDILFTDLVLQELIRHQGDVVVVADRDWHDYWVKKNSAITEDSESFMVNEKNELVSLGKPDPPIEEMHARYVGLIKFSKNGLETAKKVFEEEKAKDKGEKWRYSKSFRKGYMTDFLQAIIDSGEKVDALLISKNWLEFDTEKDYLLNLEMMKEQNFD